jgi:hypothetical protein
MEVKANGLTAIPIAIKDVNGIQIFNKIQCLKNWLCEDE